MATADKEQYAGLMLAIGSPLSFGGSNNDRRCDLIRKYALSALVNRDAIPLALELDLARSVSLAIAPRLGAQDEKFPARRKEGLEVLLHGWTRLADGIDPNWDPKAMPLFSDAVAADFGLPQGIAPKDVADPILRAKYEAAIAENDRKIEKSNEQLDLRGLSGRFTANTTRMIMMSIPRRRTMWRS